MIMKGFNMNDIIYKLREIFDNNKEKRICVLGTTCTGKSTFINEMNKSVLSILKVPSTISPTIDLIKAEPIEAK